VIFHLQVGRSAKSHLPSILRTVYELLNIFQLEINIVHPNCVGDDPFLLDKVMFGIAVILLVFSLVNLKILRTFIPDFAKDFNFAKIQFLLPNLSKWKARLAFAQKNLFLLMTLFYPGKLNKV
jgi:hypothetical protein